DTVFEFLLLLTSSNCRLDLPVREDRAGDRTELLCAIPSYQDEGFQAKIDRRCPWDPRATVPGSVIVELICMVPRFYSKTRSHPRDQLVVPRRSIFALSKRI